MEPAVMIARFRDYVRNSIRFCARYARTATTFARDTRGTVAVVFSISLVPIMVLVGAAVDYSYASMTRTKLNAVADVTALFAVSKSSMASSATSTQKDAKNYFFSRQSGAARTNVKSLTVTVTDGSSGRTALVEYEADVTASFLGLIGMNTVTVAGSATAVSGLATYMDFYLVLDNTPSMGVGATTSDINKMVANTSDQCAFACHDLSAGNNDYYTLAKKLGVQMRIDVVRQATQQLMDTANSTQAISGQFRMAIYTFGTSAENLALTTIQTLTTNLTTAKNAASAIDLMTVPYQNYASDTHTDFHTVLNGINSIIPTPGNGSQSSSPQKIVFFVSDGVADRALGSPSCSQPTTMGTDPQNGKKYNRCQEPLDVSLCTTMKNRGIKIAVLYTTYLPLPTNGWYNTWIAPFSGSIASKMQTCASPGLYFEVSLTQGISEAMTALFQKAVQQARLTQ